MSKLSTDLIGSAVFESRRLTSRERLSIPPLLPEDIRPVCISQLDELVALQQPFLLSVKTLRKSGTVPANDGMMFTTPLSGGLPGVPQWRH